MAATYSVGLPAGSASVSMKGSGEKSAVSQHLNKSGETKGGSERATKLYVTPGESQMTSSQIVELLVRAKAQVDTANGKAPEGRQPLRVQSGQQTVDAVSLLMQSKAEVDDATTDSSATLLLVSKSADGVCAAERSSALPQQGGGGFNAKAAEWVPGNGGLEGGSGDELENGDAEAFSRPGAGYSCRYCGQPGGVPGAHWHNRCPHHTHNPCLPGVGYVCKHCDQPGGVPGAHWHQKCPRLTMTTGKPGVAATAGAGHITLPGVGYVCRYCGQPGGVPGAHWHNRCPHHDHAEEPNLPGVGYVCHRCNQPGGVPGAHWHQNCPLILRGRQGSAGQRGEQNFPVAGMGANKLFVGGLPFTTTDAEVHDMFSSFGPMVECKVMTERGTTTSKGYAFVTYYERSDAEAAVQSLDEKVLSGRTLNVRFAEQHVSNREASPLSTMPPGSGGGGGAGKGKRSNGGGVGSGAGSAGSSTVRPPSRNHVNIPISGLAGNKLFVGGLPFTATDSEVFGGFGPLVECKIMTEPGTTKSKGYAFVTYYSYSDAETAVAALDQRQLHGRTLNVHFAEQSNDKSSNVAGGSSSQTTQNPPNGGSSSSPPPSSVSQRPTSSSLPQEQSKPPYQPTPQQQQMMVMQQRQRQQQRRSVQLMEDMQRQQQQQPMVMMAMHPQQPHAPMNGNAAFDTTSTVPDFAFGGAGMLDVNGSGRPEDWVMHEDAWGIGQDNAGALSSTGGLWNVAGGLPQLSPGNGGWNANAAEAQHIPSETRHSDPATPSMAHAQQEQPPPQERQRQRQGQRKQQHSASGANDALSLQVIKQVNKASPE